MPLRSKQLAALALAVILAIFVWQYLDGFDQNGAPLWPNENTVIGTWIFYVVYTALAPPAPLLGFWLLFRIRAKGGGRWEWRRWLGGLIVLLFLQESWQDAIFWLASGPNVFYVGHPWLDYALVGAAIPALWILSGTAGRERGAAPSE